MRRASVDGEDTSMDTLKLMPIGQPPSPFETGSVCGQAGLELSILLPQLACPPPLLCVYVYMDTMCGWVGGAYTTVP